MEATAAGAEVAQVAQVAKVARPQPSQESLAKKKLAVDKFQELVARLGADCPICTSRYTRQTAYPVACHACEFAPCRRCVKAYVGGLTHEVDCMGCHKPWPRTFLAPLMGASFCRRSTSSTARWSCGTASARWCRAPRRTWTRGASSKRARRGYTPFTWSCPV